MRISLKTAAIVATCILAVHLFIGIMLRDSPGARIALSDLITVGTNLLTTLCLLYAAGSLKEKKSEFYLSWAVLALAHFVYTIGDAMWAVIEVWLQQEPLPSPSDVPYLLYYVIFLYGLLLLPATALSKNERIKVFLDMGVVMVASTLLFWAFLIKPAVVASMNEDLLAQVLSVLYPVLDMLLLFALLEVLFRRFSKDIRGPLLLLASGTLILIITDTIYMRQSLAEEYIAGSLLDIGWLLSYCLIGLAGIRQGNIASDSSRPLCLSRDSSSSPAYEEQLAFPWLIYVPYVFAGSAYLLLIWTHRLEFAVEHYSMAVGVGLVIGMIMLRQILALKENSRLFSLAKLEIEERKKAEEQIKSLNAMLEDRVAKRTAELQSMNLQLKDEMTERQAAMMEWKESDRRFKELSDMLPQTVFETDANGRLTFANIQAFELFGYSRDERELGLYVIDFIAPQDRERAIAAFKDTSKGMISGNEYTLMRKNGTFFPAIVFSSPIIKAGTYSGRRGIIIDITKRKMEEDALVKARDEAEAMALAKSQFMANMSHEIRTPMNAVIGMTGLLLEGNMPPEQRDYIETIKSSGEALMQIIDDILDFSKIDGGKMGLEDRPFELQKVLEETADIVAAKAAEKKISVAYYADDGVPQTLIGDNARLRQVLVNLLGNAVKFTEQGHVTIIVSAKSFDKESRSIKLQFSVKDTGIGISKDKMGLLFRPFCQGDSSTTRRYGGTGLGLAISKKLVELMDGKIWVESADGEGSTFHFTVRLGAVLEASKEPPYPQVKGRRILIANGNADVCRMIRGMVLQSNAMPVIAANAKEVQAILSGSESFDVAIIDDTLSDMDGVTLADNIKERLGDKAPPIILLYDLGMRVDPGHNLAATIAKPVKSSQLLSTISSIIPSEEGASIKKEIVTTDEQALGATIARLKVELPQHTLRILVAEDNSVNQKVIISMLKRLGYRADLAASGIEVLEALGRQPYDLIFMDVQMPVMDGLEATRKIRSRFSQFGPKSKKLEPIIIALTAHALKGDKERCIEAGMNDYISKPVKLGDLRAIIEFYKIKKKI